MFKSLRWRLQVWHAVVLFTVLTSFGGVVYGLHWQTRLQQVDAELHRTVNAVMSQLRKLVPWRPRRTEAAKPDSDSVSRADPNVVARTDASQNETDAVKPTRFPEQSSPEQSSREQSSREQPPRERPRERPRDRPFRDPGPLPAEFDQLFHGDEESPLYYVIWGRDGEVLQKSDSAPAVEYPDLHVGPERLPVRTVRERRTDHIYREVITCLSFPRVNEQPDKGSSRPNDWNVLVGRSLEKDLAAQHHSGLRLVALVLIVLAAGLLGGGWLTARAIRPIAVMTATAESISGQNLSQRIDVKDTDSELGKLATVLNGSFDRLQAAVERQRQFTADASHELRTPLSVIATHTELALSRQRSSEDYRAAIETCGRASKRMKSLIDSLLLLARFDSGTPSLKNVLVNLDPLVRECVELVEPLATARGIRIDCRTTTCRVWGDSDRLSQVVTNLLTNAIRYNVDNGSISVATRIESATAVISVADTGTGIAEDQLPRIFDRFHQVDKARSRAEGSCGLGLSICKTIVEAHGGAITATSQVDVGTTLQVRLPVADENVTSDEPEPNEFQLASSLMKD